MKWDKKCMNCRKPVDKWEHRVTSTAIVAWNEGEMGYEVAEGFGWVGRMSSPDEDEMDEKGEYVVCCKCFAEGAAEMVKTGEF